MDYYVCPVCKTKNEEQKSYCDHCGTWLINATKLKPKPKKTKRVFLTIVIFALISIGAASTYLKDKELAFDDIAIGDAYIISQLIVKTSKLKDPTATADIQVKDFTDPIEVSIAFYDSDNKRLGKATSIISKQLSSDQVTTISFGFDEKGDIQNTANIRVEITPLSPLMLMERVGNKLSNITN